MPANMNFCEIKWEASATFVPMGLMTDSGDHQYFTAGVIWSQQAGKIPIIKPNGITTGDNLLSGTAVNDELSVAAFTADSLGIQQQVAPALVTVTRPIVDGRARINTVVMSSAGVVSVIPGTEAADDVFLETYDTAGGVPYIPVDSVMIGQFRTTSNAAAPITDAEIFQGSDAYTEYAASPIATQSSLGTGNKPGLPPASKNSHIKFNSVLPLSHTGGVTRRIYISYYIPVFATLAFIKDFVPAGLTFSANDASYYQDEHIITATSAVGSTTFVHVPPDLITDPFMKAKGSVRAFKVYPNSNLLPYWLTQGPYSVAVTGPQGAPADCTVTVVGNEAVGFDS